MSATANPLRRLAALLALIAIAVSGCAGHSGPPAPQAASPGEVGAADHVVIVAGTHANSPRPALNAAPTAAVTAAMASGGTVQVMHVSGRPSFDTDLRLQKVTGTDAGKEALVKGNLKRIGDALGRGPAADGSDLLESVAMAADALRATNAASPVLVVADSGLTDSGRLRFTADGMLGADAGEVARYLQTSGALPVLDRITVYLAGMGYSAAPQHPLDAPTRAKVAEIWRKVFEAAGARVIADTTPNTAEPVVTAFTVQPVALPAPPAQPPVCARGDIVFDAQSQVSFVAETTTYVDPAAAEAALRPVAAWLAANPRRTAFIRGTTANDGSDPARLRELGARRADTVATGLTGLGVKPAQITAAGVGADFPEYVMPDTDPATGQLLPGPAALNRSVRITLDDHC
jgi:OOP family OmpA-OmpF porin